MDSTACSTVYVGQQWKQLGSYVLLLNEIFHGELEEYALGVHFLKMGSKSKGEKMKHKADRIRNTT